MTDEKRLTPNPAEPPIDKPEKAAPVSRTEARKAHAATAAEAAAGQERPTRSRRRTEEVPEPKVRTKRSEQQAEAGDDAAGAKPVRWVQIRILPIYVRVLIVLVLLAVAVVAGAMIGYSILGDGSAGDVFHKETWTHIFDIMNGKE
ncbi:hypothetical protein NCCP2716_16700 [Sporosarcina sp. NCCP-2716]|uniref:DNA-directed RNA polymerase subunit beta n=1 Tax=Sporosarcina sp. NCCP-2716 TaxID=2943679 RepID=UPI00203D257C|nr:DNA-directed RNA polymerase subunit beta [Sporosarcina sp. NCCP-2716]GKV69172.1 hypothetical protein NCCP2716_16700 [Sporosarcina sp. NCCP-2716]